MLLREVSSTHFIWQPLQGYAKKQLLARTTLLAVVIVNLGDLDGGAEAVVEDAQQPDNQANNVGRIEGDFRVGCGRCNGCGGGIGQALHESKHARIAGLFCKRERDERA